MTADTGLMAYVVRAEGYVRNARQCWNPTNLSSCEQCGEQLRQAIEVMQAARQAAAGGPATPGAKARLERVRNEVETLSRLVDSAMAFSRGLALRMVSMIGEEAAHSDLKG
jgi:hypothetical protein